MCIMLICCTGAKVPLGIITILPFTTTWLFPETGTYNLNWSTNGQYFNVQINGVAGQPLVIPDSFFTNGANVLQLVDSSGVSVACFNACIVIGNQYVHTPEVETTINILGCGEAPPSLATPCELEPCNYCHLIACNCHD